MASAALTLYQGFQQAYPSFTAARPSYAFTIGSSRISSWLDGVSSFYSNSTPPSLVTDEELSDYVATQTTISGTVPGGLPSSTATDTTGSSSSTDQHQKPRTGGLPLDREARETKKQLLDRMRKECEADEVAVAMAPVYKIPTSYVFYPEQYKRFRTMFPRITPDPGLSFTHHDHPVAHTATLVGIRHMQQCLQGGKRYLDIYGNPNGNEAYNRFQASRCAKRPNLGPPPRIESMVYPNTSQDMVRMHNKWGPERDDKGEARYVVAQHKDIPDNEFDGFLMVHTLYYFTMLEITQLLHKNKHAKISALVNYSPEQCGTLYGELKFSKSNGMTTQTSPNGESYRHPDVDQWFQTQTFKYCPETGNDYGAYGISWTSRNIGGPLYIVEIVYCPGELAKATSYNPPEAPTLQVARGSYFAWVRFGSTKVQLKVSNHELASELRHFMVMRDRSNPQTLTDLCVKARRVTAPDLVTGTRQYAVPDGELADHIAYAYTVDAPGELELLEGVKLLRGDLLRPHADALKLNGDDKTNGLLKAIATKIGLVRDQPKPALTGTSSNHLTKQPHSNSGGLLPVART